MEALRDSLTLAHGLVIGPCELPVAEGWRKHPPRVPVRELKIAFGKEGCLLILAPPPLFDLNTPRPVVGSHFTKGTHEASC